MEQKTPGPEMRKNGGIIESGVQNLERLKALSPSAYSLFIELIDSSMSQEEVAAKVEEFEKQRAGKQPPREGSYFQIVGTTPNGINIKVSSFVNDRIEFSWSH
jgi:hypothetical protein